MQVISLFGFANALVCALAFVLLLHSRSYTYVVHKPSSSSSSRSRSIISLIQSYHRHRIACITVGGSVFYSQQQVLAESNNEEDDDDEDDDEDDFLAEILAEEQRQEEELKELEDNVKELDALKREREAQERQKAKPSGMKNPPRGTGGASASMGSKPMMNQQGANSKLFHDMDEKLRQKESEINEAKVQERDDAKEEQARIEAERIAQKREADYLADLAKVQDEKKKKRMEAQKKRDKKVVSRILSNSEKRRHYQVLGIRCAYGEFQLGPIKICQVQVDQITKAFRSMARKVHPDKNRDGRAAQAFDAVKRSAEILQDASKKREYDAKIKRQRNESIEDIMSTIQTIWLSTLKVLGAMKDVLGPFATPIIILTALII